MSNVFRINAKLGDLFPADDPDSSWLLRLAILRDDFEWEVVPKGDRPGDATEVWLSVYSWRKLAITVGEVKNIFSHDLTQYLEARERGWEPQMVLILRDAIKAVYKADEVLAPIRDGLGAHVRPSNAVQREKKPDPTPEILRRHAEEHFEVVLDARTGEETSFCGVTSMAFMLAWPEATTQGEYVRLRTQMHQRFMACFNPIRHGIDLLFAIRWGEAGLLSPSFPRCP
jgi:hypothetical protein